MKINSNLFPPSAAAPRVSGDASEARRAFEAMLSASAARTRATAAPTPTQDGTLTSAMRQSVRIQTDAPSDTSNDTPIVMARPGRVLDIKV